MSRDSLYENVIRPILFSFDPEEAHNVIHSMLTLPAAGVALASCRYKGSDLQTNFLGTKLSNPVGLAAGFDKNGSLVSVLGDLGFGFAEIGSVCARPHGGNPRPRLFRLPQDEALINRLGLNGLGAEIVGLRLASARPSLPIGLNIAKTNDATLIGDAAIEDVMQTFTRLHSLPVAYFTINASCPNTKEGCIKETNMLSNLFAQVRKANTRQAPILVKLSPDSTDDFVQEIVAMAIDQKLAGFVCGNTTIKRDGLLTSSEAVQNIGLGGLSGRPLKSLNENLCRKVFRLKQPDQVIIGVGGVGSGQDVFDYLKTGASVVQLYTAMVYRGPRAVKQICQELSEILKHSDEQLGSLIGSAV
ncbi:MAG: quinone-dependent dihydroorotate dehydrogenase [Candidatus Obscuribacterales bacterium]|nr:quinone-dependent dihydroorotate dehydrogenase [Candidatus Obscuribacterales bacterium]